MASRSQFAAICVLMAIVNCGTLYAMARADSASVLTLNVEKVRWQQLSFYAKKRFQVEVHTQVDLNSLPAADVEAYLLASPQGDPIKPLSTEVAQMTLKTTIEPFLGATAKIQNRVWFNPQDATALGRVRMRRGNDDFKKIYRFTQQGVFRHRMEPKGSREADLEPEKWTDVKNSYYRYDLKRMECTGVTDRALLLVILSAGALSNHPDVLSFCVFGKRQLHRVELRAQGFKPIAVSYLEKTPRTEIRRKKQIQALKIHLRAEPMESDLDEAENFSFFGLHHDISIFIDPKTGYPIRICGIIHSIGKVELKLNEVHLSQASD